MNILISDQETEISKVVLKHPWRRLLARSLDMSIYGLIWSWLELLVFRFHFPDNLLITLMISYLTMGIAIVIEPLLLSTFGTTIGKWVFGLKLRNADGSKLTYVQGINRIFNIFEKGIGYCLPIYSLICAWRCKINCLEGYQLEWDEGLSYEIKDLKLWRGWLYAVLYMIIFIAVMLIVYQGMMPKYSAPLTVEKYIANINDLQKMQEFKNGRYMDENGKWYEEENYNDINFVLGAPPANHQLIIEDSIVKGVKIEFENDASDLDSRQQIQKLLITRAFFGAQKGVNFFDVLFSKEIKDIFGENTNYSFEYKGCQITIHEEMEGCSIMGVYLIPDDNEKESRYKMMFEIKLND